MRYLKFFLVMLGCSAMFAFAIYLINNTEQAKEAILPQEKDRSFVMPKIERLDTVDEVTTAEEEKIQDTGESVGEEGLTAEVPAEDSAGEQEAQPIQGVEEPTSDGVPLQENQLF